MVAAMPRPKWCAVGALMVFAISGLAGSAAAQAPGGPDCANPPQTADLRLVYAAQGKTFTWHVPAGYLPGCDEPGDPLSVTVDWGDGTSSAASVAPVAGQDGAPSAVAEHIYQRPGTYPIVVVQRNERTRVARSDNHYQAKVLRTGLIVARRPLSWWPGRRFSGALASFSPQGAEVGPERYLATIAWGDGTTSRGKVAQWPGVVEIRGTHTWRRALRSRNVTVTLTEASTGAVVQIRKPLKPRKTT
jgi:hypothetical protein